MERLKPSAVQNLGVKNYQALLRRNRTRHETSAPYSPHQNGAAERNGRALFDTARWMLLESELPTDLWPNAAQTAAAVRNRCFNSRTKQTPYFLLTGRRPNLSGRRTFGSVCSAYKRETKELDSGCEKGIFVGYEQNSAAYFIYCPNSEKVEKHRLVKKQKKKKKM